MARTITVVVLAILWLGCGSETFTPQDASPVETTAATVDGLLVEVAVHPLVLKRGETLQIRLSVTNTASTPVRKAFSSGCIYGYTVRDNQGIRVAPAPRICTANAPVVAYAPGETVTQEYEWVNQDPSIRPGRYEVSAGFGRWGEGGPPPVAVTVQ